MKDFYEKYNLLHKEVNEACACILSNPCSKLKEEIQEIKDTLDRIIVSEWEDTAGEKFRINQSECATKLSIIIVSITSIFEKSEVTYNRLKEQLNNLNIVNQTYKEIYDLKPNRKGVNDKDYNKYENEYIEWENFKNKLEDQCYACIDGVEKYLRILEDINLSSISITASMNQVLESVPMLYVPESIDFSYGLEIERNYLFDIIEDSKIDAEGARALVNKLGANNVEVTYYEKSGKIGIRYNQGANTIWNSKENRVDGVNVHVAGCSLMALAGVVSSVLSNQNGTITYVTPTQLAKDLSNYSRVNGTGNMTKYISNSGLNGDYQALGEAISEIYGVSVVVNSKGNLNYNNYQNILDSDTSIMYSCANQRHINAAYTAPGNNIVYECDTGTGKANYLTSGTSYDPSKRAIYISSSFDINDGYLTRNGEVVSCDLGSINSIISNGKTYSLVRTEDGKYQVTGIVESNSKYLENLKNNS